MGPTDTHTQNKIDLNGSSVSRAGVPVPPVRSHRPEPPWWDSNPRPWRCQHQDCRPLDNDHRPCRNRHQDCRPLDNDHRPRRNRHQDCRPLSPRSTNLQNALLSLQHSPRQPLSPSFCGRGLFSSHSPPDWMRGCRATRGRPSLVRPNTPSG